MRQWKGLWLLHYCGKYLYHLCVYDSSSFLSKYPIFEFGIRFIVLSFRTGDIDNLFILSRLNKRSLVKDVDFYISEQDFIQSRPDQRFRTDDDVSSRVLVSFVKCKQTRTSDNGSFRLYLETSDCHPKSSSFTEGRL